MSMPRAHPADAMPKIHSIHTARTLRGPVMYGEDDAVSLTQAHDPRSSLHAQPLLGHHKLASLEVSFGFGEKDRQLQRKDVLSVKILMQTVVVSRLILQQQWSWLRLSSFVTALNEVGMLLGKTHINSQRRIPPVCDRYEMRISRGSQFRDQLRQRISEVFVLTASEAMA